MHPPRRRARLILPAALAVTSLAAPLGAITACDDAEPGSDAALAPRDATADVADAAPDRLDAGLDAPLDAPPDAPA